MSDNGIKMTPDFRVTYTINKSSIPSYTMLTLRSSSVLSGGCEADAKRIHQGGRCVKGRGGWAEVYFEDTKPPNEWQEHRLSPAMTYVN